MMWIRGAFWLSAIYDVVIGLVFLVLGDSLFDRFEVPPPSHPGYYEFPALMLIIFGVLFAQIAINPAKHRGLIIYGMGLKASCSGLILYHHFVDGVSGFWISFAFADVGFLVLFSAAFVAIGKRRTRRTETHGAGAWG